MLVKKGNKDYMKLVLIFFSIKSTFKYARHSDYATAVVKIAPEATSAAAAAE